MFDGTKIANKILYSSGNNDECYTPSYAVNPILEYINPDWTIWCPFDTEQSKFVQVLKSNNINVIHSHITEGKDFYNYIPESHFDCIISNPPYTNKRKIFERAIQLNKPFALLMSNTWLNDSAPKQLFMNIDLQLLMFDKRIRYVNNGIVNNKITFSSSYYCWHFLPKQIIMKNLCIK